jgi:hypothetical protein
MVQYLSYSGKIMQGMNITKDMQFLFQTEQVRNFPQHFCMVYFNIILPPMPGTSLQVSPQMHAFLTCALCATCPALTKVMDFIILIMPK